MLAFVKYTWRLQGINVTLKDSYIVFDKSMIMPTSCLFLEL